MLEEMKKFYKSNPDFKDFVDSNMRTYQKDFDYILTSPITKEYYKMKLAKNSGKEGKE